MIRYPNGKTFTTNSDSSSSANKRNRTRTNSANRGMSFESDINVSNDYYRDNHRALITKRPTPINIVKVDYSHGARITDAYFEAQSTTDYNGIYRGRYIDFEAKSCHNKTSFPLANITSHQIEHLSGVIEHGGIAFFLISLVAFDEVYLLDAQIVIDVYKSNTRKSIPFKDLKELGHLVKQGYLPRLLYLDTVDEVYFHEKNL